MAIDYSSLPVHPAADLFPMLGAEEHLALVASVREHGLLQPLVIIEVDGDLQLLDGRNRLAACIEANVLPHHVVWEGEGGDPVRYVWARNGERRHLSPGQRAAAAVAMLPLLEAQARQRQGARTDLSGRIAGKSSEAREEAAQAVGVSARYVSDAKRISASAPAVFDALRVGAVTIPQAKMLAQVPVEARPTALERVAAAPEKQRTKVARKIAAENRTAPSTKRPKKLGPPPARPGRVLDRLHRRQQANLADLDHLDRDQAIEWLEAAVEEFEAKLGDVRATNDVPQQKRPVIRKHNRPMEAWRKRRPDLPTGAIIYEGLSRFTGEPVVVVLTRLVTPTSNSKTGDMVQSYILPRQTHPGEAVKTGKDVAVCGASCPRRPFLGGNCYVHAGTGISSRLWSSLDREDLYERWTPQQAAEVLTGAAVRVGSWGDPTAVPVEVWSPIVKTAATYTAYTHYWREVDVAVWGWAMASVDSPDEAREARALGWRTFRVREPGHGVLEHERECSAVAQAVPCIACRGCDGVTRAPGRPSYWIRPHGFRAEKG